MYVKHLSTRLTRRLAAVNRRARMPETLRDAFARVNVNDDARVNVTSDDAITRAFSAPADFPELGALDDSALVDLLTSDDAFSRYVASTSHVNDSATFVNDLRQDITRVCAVNERLVEDLRATRARAAATRASDADAARRAFEATKREYDEKRSSQTLDSVLVKLDSRRDAANAASEEMLVDVRRVPDVASRAAIDDFARQYLALRMRAHEAAIIADIVRTG